MDDSLESSQTSDVDHQIIKPRLKVIRNYSLVLHGKRADNGVEGSVETLAGGKGMIVLVAVVVLGLPLAALLFGVDSRDGRDWQSPSGLPSQVADRDLARSTGAAGVVRFMHRRGRVRSV